MNNRLRQAFKTNKNSFKKRRPIIRATLGNGKGTVETARDNFVYARTTDGNIVIVLNKRVANTDGLAVFLGYTEQEPFVMQVLGETNVYNVVADAQLPNHGKSHEWPYSDTVFVQGEQFAPLLTLPYSGTSVEVYGGIIYTRSGTVYAPTQYVDLQSYVPITGAMYALIGLNATGTAVVQPGNLKTSVNTLIPSDIPVPISGTFPVSAIRLKSGQSTIEKTASVRDIVDLRWAGYSVLSDAEVVFVLEDGVLVAKAREIDFTGDGVSVSATGTRVTVNIPGASGSGGGGGVGDGIGIYGQDEGVPLATGTVLNVVGDGATLTASGTVLNLNVPGSGGGGMTQLDQIVLSSSTGTISFVPISADYDLLVVDWNTRSTYSGGISDQIRVNVNGDVGNNYDYILLQLSNSGLIPVQAFAAAFLAVGYAPSATAMTNSFSTGRILIHGYARTNFLKSFQSRTQWFHSAVNGYHAIYDVGLHWRSLSAINQLSFTLQNSAFASGTVFTLWGV